jgi:serine/threonine protein phosphatase 1
MTGNRKNLSQRSSIVQTRRRIEIPDLDAETVIYAIPDIHGCLVALQDAEDRIMADITVFEPPRDRTFIVYLGDYVDRGPSSAQVLSHLTETSLDGVRRIMLCGNHDDMFLSFLKGRIEPTSWLGVGGRETLMSYGMSAREIARLSSNGERLAAAARNVVRSSHVIFLKTLPVAVMFGSDYLFVHAGIMPGRALADQSDEHLMWIREPFLQRGPELPLIVVHGHTIVPAPMFVHRRIGLDTGAYTTGRLSVLKILDRKAYFV